MPKAVLTINDFSGGQNTTTNSRDLEPNELVLCENLDPIKIGRVHAGRKLSNGATTSFGGAPITGHGIVVWSNDYQLDALSTAGFTGIFIGRSSGTEFIVFETSDGTTGTNRGAVVTGLPTTQSYYVAEGDVYIGGATGSTWVAPKSLTLHHRLDFPGTAIERTVRDWKVFTQTKTAPVDDTDVDIHFGYIASGDPTPAPTIPADAVHWVIGFGAENTGGWINDANKGTDDYLVFASSWLYKNKAESALTPLALGNFTGRNLSGGPSQDAVSSALRIQAWMDATNVGTHDTAARSGARLYVKLKSDAVWFLVAEIDFEKGIIGDLETEWTSWATAALADPPAFNDSAADPTILCSTGWIKNPAEQLTFEALNFYKESLIPTGGITYWATGCVANSRAYVANVQINGRSYPDRILKSPLYNYDVFTEDLIVDTAMNDGDQIVKLETFSDRILIFKHNSVMVLNVSQIQEQVESEFSGAGIENPGAVTKTPAGIVWANRSGTFLFNGEEIKSLNQRLEKVR